MTCRHCTAANKGAHFVFDRNCKACCARDVAAGPHFHASRQAGKQTREYRAQLNHYGVTHEAVVRASEVERAAA